MGGAAGAGVRWAHRPMVRRPPIRVAAGRETQGSRGLGDARFERLGRCCGVKCAEPSDSGCVASSSLIATSRGPRHEAGAASLPKPTWLARCSGTAYDHDDVDAFTKNVLSFWANWGKEFPTWAIAMVMRIVGSFTPNSAAAERVFSSLKLMFGDICRYPRLLT